MNKPVSSKRAVARLLRKGANLIQKEGLARGRYRPNPLEGGYCMLGSLGYPVLTEKAIYARDALGKVIGVTSVISWSDANLKDTVIHYMRKTAAALEHGLKVYA